MSIDTTDEQRAIRDAAWRVRGSTPFNPDPPIFEVTLEVGPSLPPSVVAGGIETLCQENLDLTARNDDTSIDGHRWQRLGFSFHEHFVFLYDANGESRFPSSMQLPDQLRMISHRNDKYGPYRGPQEKVLEQFERFYDGLNRHLLGVVRFLPQRG